MRQVTGRVNGMLYRTTTVAVLVWMIGGYHVDSSCALETPASLAAEKLQPLGNSGVWLCEEERQLRQDLASLPALRQTIEGLQKGLTSVVTANAKRWAVTNSAASSPSTNSKSGLKDRDKAAGRGASGLVVDPAEIGNVPVVRRHVIQLTNARIQLALTLSRLRRTSSQMATAYDRLAKDQAVQTALASVGANQRLGPASDYDLDLQRLREYFPFAETPWVPVYLQGQHLRFTGICNERTPATFTWSPNLTHALVTTGSFHAAGLKLPDEAKRVRFQYKGSAINVYPVRIPYLQFGSCIVRDVPAYLLPPEFEYLGNRIGGSSFEGYRVRPAPARLRVSFESRQ